MATIAASEPPDDGRDRRVGLAVWVASGAIHAAALAAMAALVICHPVHEDPPIVIPQSPIGPIHRDPPPPPRIPVDHQGPTLPVDLPATEAAAATPVDLAVTTPDDAIDVPDELPHDQGDLQAVVDSALSTAPGVFSAIGASQGDASRKGDGPFQNRHHTGSPPGTIPRINVVTTRHALDWFKRHQSPDGSWSATGYWRNCTDAGPKCEPGTAQAGDTDVALTGYALLCFLGDGYDADTPSRYRPVVRRALDWLLSRQGADGLLGSRNYEHAVAAMALAQAYAMAPQPALRSPTQRAIDALLARQCRDRDGAAVGWDYAAASGRNDASVTGWCVMALKSAHVAGLRVGDGLDGCQRWLTGSWRTANSGQPWCAAWERLGPTDQSRFPYVWTPATRTVEIAPWDPAARRPQGEAHDLAAVGLMCAVFLGRPSGDPMLETLANYVAGQQQPAAWPCNTYYLYYGTLGLYQVGGERWRRWDAAVTPLLAGAQRRDEGCMDGSWDWQGTRFHGNDTGRVLSTAYACLTMQAHWLYARQLHAARP